MQPIQTAPAFATPERAGSSDLLRPAGLVLGASLFVAACSHIAVPLSFSPVPFTLQPFAVILVALLLGPAMGGAALVAYLVEGASGAPVFTPGIGGLAQMLGPTGGFLLSYPLAAMLCGALNLSGIPNAFLRATVAGVAGIAVIYACGISHLSTVLGLPYAAAFKIGGMPFLLSDAVKVLAAAGITTALQKRFSAAQNG